jgi:hypothetical protein
MNFAALPPEVNSALMYSGAGSGPIRAAATPTAVREIALVSAQSGAASAAAAAGVAEAETPFAEMALAGMAGRAMAGTVGPGRRTPMTTQPNSTAAPGPPVEAPNETGEPEDTVTGVQVLAELRGLAELRDSGVLTDEEFNKQRERVIETFVDE